MATYLDYDGLVSLVNEITSSDSNLQSQITENKITNSDGTITISSSSDSSAGTLVSVGISDKDYALSVDSGLKVNLAISDAQTDEDVIKKYFSDTYTNIKEIYLIYGKGDNYSSTTALASNNAVFGAIPIYKDSALQQCYLGTTKDYLLDEDEEGCSDTSEVIRYSTLSTDSNYKEDAEDALVFIYQLATGQYSLVAVNVADFLRSHEFDTTMTVVNTGSAVTGVNIDNLTIKQVDDNAVLPDQANASSYTDKLYVVNALSDNEKYIVEKNTFDAFFTAKITYSSDASTTSGAYSVFDGSSYAVTWTLTTSYSDKDGNTSKVDLKSVPSGWTRINIGVYTKTTTVSKTTGASFNSGSVTCDYNTGNNTFTSTVSAVTHYNVKYSYIYCTTESSISSLDDLDFLSMTKMNTGTSNTISGSKSINFAAGQYAYFIVANTSNVSSITQLGLNYINSVSYMERTNYGTYKVYRSINSMGAGTQSVTVA